MDGIEGSILLLLLLTPASLFFSLNSLALRSFSLLKLQEAFKAAGKEDRIEAFLNHAEPLTLTCLILQILCNVGIVLALIHLLIGQHYLITFLTAVFILEIIILVIPHAWAKHASEHILPRTYPLLKILMWITKPILEILNLHDRLVRRLAGVQEVNPEEMEEEKQEEILSYVEQGKIEGFVDEEEMEMIENVFELGETTADEIMTPRTDLIAVSVEMDLPSILETIEQAGHSRIPVYEENIDSIVGMLYAKDLLSEIGKDPQQFNLKEKMRKPYFVPESKLLRDLLAEFKKQKLHFAVVLDEYGGTAGIVTIEDILEELVGEITDEYEETPTESYKQINESTWQVDARMHIEDVNEELGIELPEEEDYDTLGGFVFSHLGYIPKTGESLEYKNIKLTITGAEPRSIRRVRIEKTPDEKNGGQ